MMKLNEACKVPGPEPWFVRTVLFLILKHRPLSWPAWSEHVLAMLLVQLIPHPASIACLFSPGAQTQGPKSPGSTQMVSNSRVVFPVEIM